MSMDDWGQTSAGLATSVADDAISGVSSAPLRVLEAHAETDRERLTTLYLTVRTRGVDQLDLLQLVVEARSDSERVWLASRELGELRVELLHDEGRSALGGLLEAADTAEFQVDLDLLDTGVRGGEEFVLMVHFPDSPPLELLIQVPEVLRPIVALQVVERL